MRISNLARNIVTVIIIANAIALIWWMWARGDGKTGRTVAQSVPTISAPTTMDGLHTPDASSDYPLDEIGAGRARVDVFSVDINGDNIADRITRTLNETGNAHSYYEYKIELGSSRGFTDVTPNDMRTLQGADCVLQQIRFENTPEFRIIKISRPLGDSWDAPTRATRTTYGFVGGRIRVMDTRELGIVCDVSELM